MTRNIEKLKDTLSLISHLRKFVILKFTPDVLSVISVNGGSVQSEPQINIDLLLQTLKNFDKANSEGLNIRLQRTETNGEAGAAAKTGRTASLALFYSNLNINSNVINHTFRIPVKILREAQDILHEPTHSDIGLIMRLPNEFISMFKRLDKFKKTQNDTVLIQASMNDGLSFILEEEGKFKVTLSWNNKLEVHKPNNPDAESLRESLRNSQGMTNNTQDNNDAFPNELDSNVKLRDWQSASKLVGRCKTVILYIAERECSLHCLLDETEDVEMVYFINSVRVV
ncbi:MEC3 [Candida jiufengensis]|uniref:MEC3 n=1 Tax=Candida jiufengensis TaxID=497108 RepID=UPI00222574E8|nr:MEC3 [Candida jiufengensis]KAI5953687.1 MEC3 [Candida jiufengensis]